VPADSVEEQWDLEGLEKKLESEFFLALPVADWARADSTLEAESIARRVIEAAGKAYAEKFAPIEADVLHHYERAVMLQSIDTHWREHLAALDYLRQGIHLRGYAQKQPKQEYKREAFELFGQMLDAVKNQVTRVLTTVKVQSSEQIEEAAEELEQRAERVANVTYTAPTETGEVESTLDTATAQAAQRRPIGAAMAGSLARVGRNDPCPCGSGKKYKHCHGQLT
jgi:preprotein translocase subunit SecA